MEESNKQGQSEEALENKEENALEESVQEEQITKEARLQAYREMSDQELEALIEKAEASERHLDLARRTQAEFDNYQKRLEKQREVEARYAISGFVRELLGTIDNLERALQAAEQASEFEPLFEGVKMTYKGFLQSFEKFGVKPIKVLGEEFNPEVHEALNMVQDPEKEANSIVDCFEQGWRLHDRVLRPAKVSVNKLA